MLIIKNSERFLDALFIGNVKRKKFRGQVVIPDDSFGVVEVDYLFDMPQHFVFCLVGNENSKIVVKKDLPTFAVGEKISLPEPEPIETIDETPKATRGRKKREND